jgi:hypothetical protein
MQGSANRLEGRLLGVSNGQCGDALFMDVIITQRLRKLRLFRDIPFLVI